MASFITAGNATNGLQVSSDNTGILELRTGTGSGTTALTLNASQKLILPSTTVSTASAGLVEYDGRVIYATPQGTQRGVVPGAQFFRLDSALAGANVNTAQNVLGVGVTLSASTVYAFEAVYAGTKTAGTTSHSIGFGFGGTATLNNISYFALGNNTLGGFPALTSSTTQLAYVNTAANTAFIGATSSASVCYFARISGTVSINAGGTFIPQYTLSAAPGGAYTTAAGSYFMIYPIGASGANTSVGTWA